MSEASGFGDFGKWVPGFEFLQSLTRPAAAPSAGPAAWVAPTLSEEEIDKRVQELKAVLFWLEQNATALKATIQALEVQKMTLSALKGMNVSLQDMAQAFAAKSPAGAGTAAPAAPVQAEATAPHAKPKPAAARPPKPRGQAQATASAACKHDRGGATRQIETGHDIVANHCKNLRSNFLVELIRIGAMLAGHNTPDSSTGSALLRMTT